MVVGKILCVLRAQIVIVALEMFGHLQFSSGNDLLCALNTQITISGKFFVTFGSTQKNKEYLLDSKNKLKE